jgi:hypothetical protein
VFDKGEQTKALWVFACVVENRGLENMNSLQRIQHRLVLINIRVEINACSARHKALISTEYALVLCTAPGHVSELCDIISFNK